MAFWSDYTLGEKGKDLITPFDTKRIEHASYELSLGSNAFVTTESDQSIEATPELFTYLSNNQRTLQIHPGQLGFLTTDEIVRVPKDAIAFISMKAKYKFKGLINISGFHVDPGFEGRLIFSVYNAGPSPVLLEFKESVFIIMYADLDKPVRRPYSGKSQNQDRIKADLVAGLMSDVFSPQTLKKKLERLNVNIDKLVNYAWVIAAVTSAFASLSAIIIAALIFFPDIPAAVMKSTLERSGFYVIDKEKHEQLELLLRDNPKNKTE